MKQCIVVAITLSLLNLNQSLVPVNALSPTVRSVDCAVIGGGPAGCAAAVSLLKASPSTSVSVFERDNFEPKGASIRISTRGWKALKQLDATIVPKLKKTCVQVTSTEMKPWKKSESVGEKQKRSILQKIKKLFSKALMFVLVRTVLKSGVHLWHDIRMVLKEHAVQCSGDSINIMSKEIPFLNSNCRLTGVKALENEGDERFELTFEKGTETFQVKTKFLIACDGTKSNVRDLLPKEPDVLLAEDKSVWRGLAPDINVHGKATFYRGEQTAGETAGRSGLIFPAGKNAGASWTVISDLEDGKSGDMEEAKARALKVIKTMGEDYNPDYDAMKDVIENSKYVIESKLKVRDFSKPWEAAYDGLLFLGDAAHPVRPTGEGMALAFEDAVVLGQAISDSEGSALSVASLRKYEKDRYLPIKTISDEIRENAASFYEQE